MISLIFLDKINGGFLGYDSMHGFNTAVLEISNHATMPVNDKDRQIQSKI